jgi:hypothetical protein
MPATMMHLLAGHALRPNGSDSFFLGCILPDCVDAHRELKDRLHFRDVPSEERIPSLIRFGHALDLKRDFDLGVLLHFYLDYLWDNGPQSAHRRAYEGEDWFRDYRKELKMAGSRTAQRSPWNREVWLRLASAEPSQYENSLGLPEAEIRTFLEFNSHWHVETALEESAFFTDAVVENFIRRAIRAFREFCCNFFPQVAQKRNLT